MIENSHIFRSNRNAVNTWKKFARRVRLKGPKLLARLDEFPDSVLITGCQRSGTTMLTNIFNNSDGMARYSFGRDAELDGALILSGYVDHFPRGRYCFQTTYLNESYCEYFEKRNGHKIVWVIRNPFSVVCSLMYNWKSYALNELFGACGSKFLNDRENRLYGILGPWGVRKIRRACLSYNGKMSQLFELQTKLESNSMFIVDYDRLVEDRYHSLKAIYDFINLEFKDKYASEIHAKSLKKADRLTPKQVHIIRMLCMPIYESASNMLSI